MNLQRPTEIDASFLYMCPNTSCNNKHWLFLREVKTKNFRVVCECGVTFKPKQIEDLKIKFVKKSKQECSDKQSDKVPVDLLVKCGKILEGYGCSEDESKDLVTKAYQSSPTNDALQLVKLSLQLLEINNV